MITPVIKIPYIKVSWKILTFFSFLFWRSQWSTDRFPVCPIDVLETRHWSGTRGTDIHQPTVRTSVRKWSIA